MEVEHSTRFIHCSFIVVMVDGRMGYWFQTPWNSWVDIQGVTELHHTDTGYGFLRPVASGIHIQCPCGVIRLHPV